jgi:hypothetical protein
MQRYRAIVQSIDDKGLALQLHGVQPADLPSGQYIMITEAGEDVDYYTEVIERDGSSLRMKRMWTGKRGYFRVDDVFPVLWRTISAGETVAESRIFSGYAAEAPAVDLPDGSVSPHVWKLLVDINAKLDVLLERRHLEREGIAGAESIAVNISASGMRFSLNRRHTLDDVIEIKMLLPTYPPVGILAQGRVVRVEDPVNGLFMTSLSFLDLTEGVRDVIIQYTLRRQREIVRRHRERDRSV